ncbi:MAG: hypothetical protein QXY82_05225 [Desulfurococcaceae archaeon]
MVGVSMRGLVKGLVVTGAVGFALVALLIYLYLVLIKFALTLDFALFMLVTVTAGVLVIYLSVYFMHVCVDSAIILYGLKKRGLRGFDTCVQEY